MGFRLVPKSVTLNDLERRNDHSCVFSPNSVALRADYVKVGEDRPIPVSYTHLTLPTIYSV